VTYYVIHTDGPSVECLLQMQDLESALAKAFEIAVSSGFFEAAAEESPEIDIAEETANGREDLRKNHFVNGWGGRCDQRVTVKRAWVGSAATGTSGAGGS